MLKDKRKEELHMVQFLIQVFQIGCVYFLGTCTGHCFADGRSVKILASAKTDDTGKNRKKK